MNDFNVLVRNRVLNKKTLKEVLAQINLMTGKQYNLRHKTIIAIINIVFNLGFEEGFIECRKLLDK